MNCIAKHAEGALIVAQGHRKQDDYLNENTHEIHRSVCPVIARAELRVEMPHQCELWSTCLPHTTAG